jgi:hypothetical protein
VVVVMRDAVVSIFAPAAVSIPLDMLVVVFVSVVTVVVVVVSLLLLLVELSLQAVNAPAMANTAKIFFMLNGLIRFDLMGAKVMAVLQIAKNATFSKVHIRQLVGYQLQIAVRNEQPTYESMK